MAKKRRDSERDPSSAKRVLKAGGAVLAVGAGMALLSRSGKLSQLNDVMPVLKDTSRKFNKELLGKKKTALNYYNAYNKSIGKKGEVVKKALRDRKDTIKNAAKSLDYNPSTARLTNVPGKLKHIAQTSNVENIKNVEQLNFEEIKKGIKKGLKTKKDGTDSDFLKKYTERYKDKIIVNKKNQGKINDIAKEKAEAAIDQIVRETMAKYKEIPVDKDGRASTDFLKRTKEMFDIDDDDLTEMVSNIVKTTRDSVAENKKLKVYKMSEPLSKEVKEQHLKDLKKHTRDNRLINKIGKKIGIENLDDVIFGSHQATVGEVLNPKNLKKLGLDEDDFEETITNRLKTKGRENEQFLNSLRELKKLNKDHEYDDIIFDKNLRVKKNKNGELEFIDLTETMEMFDKMGDKFDSTIIGRILTKGIDRKGMRNAPKSYMLLPDRLSSAAYLDGADDNILREAKYVINNKIFSVVKKEDGYHLGEQLAEGHSVNMMHGSFSGVLKTLLGSIRQDPMSSKNLFMQLLDIGQSGRPNVFERIYQWAHKFENPDWERNIINRTNEVLFADEILDNKIKALEQTVDQADEGLKRLRDLRDAMAGKSIEEKISIMAQYSGMDAVDIKARLYEDFKVIGNLYKNRASHVVLDDDAVEKMRFVTDTILEGGYDLDTVNTRSFEKLRSLMDLSLSDARPEDILDSLLELQANNEILINSKGLSRILNNYQSNAAATLEMISIESRRTKKIPILSMEMSETNVEDISGIIRREILKEITTEQYALADVIRYTPLQSNEFEALEILNQWQKWQDATMSSEEDNIFTGLFAKGGKVDKYIKELHQSDASMYSVSTLLSEFKSDFGILSRGTFNGLNESYAPEYNTFDFISKSNIGLDMISKENNWTKFKSAMKEFNAGRKDTEHITPVTLVTQYMINRLSQGVEDTGLALSYRSTASPLDSIKNMMLKRVLPAMAAFTAFDYLNDLSQDVTGVGITGALANNVANFDILGRGLAYKTGIGQGLDWFKRTSVIAEYWTGSTDFQTAEERKEWYQDGYSPVRKSRFWGFGSASEFRGGDISFFQPNYLRRIHSDYKDKVLYGSNSEKWAHSIVPTPTHPLSTIRYLMDPYWLERKHIDDAPTPLTGKMFSEGSFWGAILNPTVGEIIKPQIMLPEIKKRMTGKGHDVKGIVRRINERIKRKASEYDDMLVVNGTDIRNATYVPYGNATPGTLTVTQSPMGPQIRGMDYMEGVQDIAYYRTPDGTTITEKQAGGFGPPVTRRVYDDSIINNTVNEISQQLSRETGVAGQELLNNINAAIKNRGRAKGRGRQGGPSFSASTPDSQYEGTYIYNNLVNEYNTYMQQWYSDKLDPAMLNTNKYGDYLRDVKHSAKNLAGIYGFLGEQFFGEDSFTLRYESASSYASFSKGFWDAGIGGLGGGFMEIARRFFPSSDKSRIDYNPLVNNMPEWLPDKFHYGVPWTKVTKGEMRLPGKGYEALNELHPDEFADENGYGSFDKFKILADVAPNSNEYKIWHNIVKHNIKDPELKAEIKEIEARTKRMSGSHEFYDYQYLHTDTEYNKGVIKTINNDGTITLANNQILTLAGIEFNENYDGQIHNFIKPGQRITYRTDTPINDPIGDGVIRRAAVYVGDENINKKLMDMGVAERDMSDTSAIGNLATVSAQQEAWGGVQELIAHARIPFVHNKLMHIETPLESYISEQVYGANFQTWDHPIEGFVKPMLNEVAGQSIFRRALARGYREFHFEKVMTRNSIGFGNKAAKFASGTVLATLDPAAFLGGGLGFLIRLNNGRNGKGNQSLSAFSKGAKIGGAVGDVVWAWNQADDPLSGAIAFGALAGDLWRKFELGEFAEQVLKKSVDMKGAMAIGAGIGLGVSALKNTDWDKERMFGKWTPKKYKKINEMNEYFDRLEYIKYKGLYEAASRKAALIEKADIKGVFKDLDRNKAKIAKLKRKAEKLLKKHDEGDSEYKAEMARIQNKIASLEETGNHVFKGGKYTKSAVAYKKAMESTIYGLKEGATKDEILAAIPDQYKDYFQKFIDVKDPKERKKIMKYMPDYLKRPLQLAWGEKLSKVESNRKYFKTHKLPGVGWRGWKPNINLKHVQMKTVQNEGMLLADFGFYESEKGKAAYTVAPDINNYDKPNRSFSMFNSIRLMSEMKGLGLGLTNVSIDRTSAPGMWISADIKQSIEDRTEIASNSITNVMQGLAANFF